MKQESKKKKKKTLAVQYDCPLFCRLAWGKVRLDFVAFTLYLAVSCKSPACLGLRHDGSLLEEAFLENRLAL